jgi:hypothetical protein
VTQVVGDFGAGNDTLIVRDSVLVPVTSVAASATTS